MIIIIVVKYRKKPDGSFCMRFSLTVMIWFGRPLTGLKGQVGMFVWWWERRVCVMVGMFVWWWEVLCDGGVCVIVGRFV